LLSNFQKVRFQETVPVASRDRILLTVWGVGYIFLSPKKWVFRKEFQSFQEIGLYTRWVTFYFVFQFFWVWPAPYEFHSSCTMFSMASCISRWKEEFSSFSWGISGSRKLYIVKRFVVELVFRVLHSSVLRSHSWMLSTLVYWCDGR